jgi:hypothetical protein
VASRLLKGKVSEALLLIDEPNSGLPAPVSGFGPAEPFTFCRTPLSGCPAWAQQAAGTDGATYEVAVNSPNASASPGNAAPNVFQGVVSANQLTFFGVPVLAPGNNAARVLRITNVRLDASQIVVNTAATPVQATIVSSDPKNLPLANPTPIVAFVLPASLTTSTTTPPQLVTCNSRHLSRPPFLAITRCSVRRSKHASIRPSRASRAASPPSWFRTHPALFT